MDKEFPIHPFETFPRQELFDGITRRQFFQTLKVEAELFARRAEGASAARISSLGCLPDEELYDLVPRMTPDARFTMKDQQVWGCPLGGGQLVPLFDLDELSSFAFNQMNGKHSLLWIAQALSEVTRLPGERAFAYTRGLFLTLVKSQVCLPVNNPQLG